MSEPQLFSKEWRDKAFEKADPHTQLLINNTENTTRIVKELQVIRWLLVVLLVIAISAIQHWWPEWWHTPWWP